jgi:hypothetical protein
MYTCVSAVQELLLALGMVSPEIDFLGICYIRLALDPSKRALMMCLIFRHDQKADQQDE